MNRNVFEAIEMIDVFQQFHAVDGVIGSKGHSIGEQDYRSDPGNLECRFESTVGRGVTFRIKVVDELERPALLIRARLHQLIRHPVHILIEGHQAELEGARELTNHSLQFLLHSPQSHARSGQLFPALVLLPSLVDPGFSCIRLVGRFRPLGERISLLHRDAGIENEHDLFTDQFLSKKSGRLDLDATALQDDLCRIEFLALTQHLLVALPQCVPLRCRKKICAGQLLQHLTDSLRHQRQVSITIFLMLQCTHHVRNRTGVSLALQCFDRFQRDTIFFIVKPL